MNLGIIQKFKQTKNLDEVLYPKGVQIKFVASTSPSLGIG
jgi:hypothetical protein